MRNVLIITTGFPPVNNISARRFGGMVKYMEEFDWRPWVITLGSQGILPVGMPEERIIRVGWANQVGNRVAEPDSSRMPRMLYLLRSLLRNGKFIFYSIDSTILGWYKDVIAETHRIDELGKMDMILASFGPPAALWLGHHFSARYHIPWVADFRDLGAIRDDNRSMMARRLDMFIEGHVLQTAVGITTVGNRLAELLMAQYKKPNRAIFNGYSLESCYTDEKSFPMRSGYPAKFVYYAGQFYPHQLDALEVFLESLKKNPDIQLLVRSAGPAVMEKEVEKIIDHFGVADTVRILPPCSPESVIYEAQLSVCNLIIEDLDTSRQWSKGTVTGKLLELLPLGPPILAVTRPDSEIGDILKKTGKGQVCSNVEEITSFLHNCGEDQSLTKVDEEAICFYSKKVQCMELCKFLDEVLRLECMQ